MNKSILVILTAVLLSSCSLKEPTSKVLLIDNQDTRVVTYPTSLRGAYFVKTDSNTRFCSEPVPDVALENLKKISANLSGTLASGDKANAELDAELKAKVIELAGRTELLLVAREMLYRACELSLNNEIDPQEVTKIYQSVTDMIIKLAAAEKKQAEAELTTAKSKLLEEEIILKSLPK